MQAYANLGGNSGVAAYEIGDGSITVEFVKGKTYLYTNASAGAGNIAQMQALAKSGRGLNTYISQNVKGGYSDKW